ncbi:MAG TPA: hypothetical protein VF472_24915 [Burkholderiaceae bacterium]
MLRKHISSLAGGAMAAVLAAVLASAPAAPAQADDLEKQLFSFAGYGTVGVVHSNQDQGDFVASYLQAEGAGYTHRWSADVDSRLGLQATADFNAQWSAVLQVLMQQNYRGDFRPVVEWANVKYQATPDFSVRLGRIAPPTFLTADYRNVGYAIPWVRTPGELYNLIPITESDGLDLRYRVHVGEASDTVQAAFGAGHIRIPQGGSVDFSAMRALTDTLEYGPATVRVTYMRARLDLDIDYTETLFGGFAQFGAPGVAIADEYAGQGTPITYAGIGASYDPGDWFLMAELGRTNAHSFLGQKSAGYVTAGWRSGKWTPYATYAQVRADSNRSDPGLPAAGLPPQLAYEVATLDAGLNALLSQIAVQKSVSLGLRWDFMKNAALKTQLNLIRVGQGSPGDFQNPQPGLGGSHATVASMVLDFVF